MSGLTGTGAGLVVLTAAGWLSRVCRRCRHGSWGGARLVRLHTSPSSRVRWSLVRLRWRCWCPLIMRRPRLRRPSARVCADLPRTILAASSLNSGMYFLRRSGIYSFRSGPDLIGVGCSESGRHAKPVNERVDERQGACRAVDRSHDCGPARAAPAVGMLTWVGTTSPSSRGRGRLPGVGPTSEVSGVERIRQISVMFPSEELNHDSKREQHLQDHQ